MAGESSSAMRTTGRAAGSVTAQNCSRGLVNRFTTSGMRTTGPAQPRSGPCVDPTFGGRGGYASCRVARTWVIRTDRNRTRSVQTSQPRRGRSRAAPRIQRSRALAWRRSGIRLGRPGARGHRMLHRSRALAAALTTGLVTSGLTAGLVVAAVATRRSRRSVGGRRARHGGPGTQHADRVVRRRGRLRHRPGRHQGLRRRAASPRSARASAAPPAWWTSRTAPSAARSPTSTARSTPPCPTAAAATTSAATSPASAGRLAPTSPRSTPAAT